MASITYQAALVTLQTMFPHCGKDVIALLLRTNGMYVYVCMCMCMCIYSHTHIFQCHMEGGHMERTVECLLDLSKTNPKRTVCMSVMECVCVCMRMYVYVYVYRRQLVRYLHKEAVTTMRDSSRQ